MATTVYSTAYNDSGAYTRAKLVYTISSTNTTTTISGTIYLQHSGKTYEYGGFKWGAGIKDATNNTNIKMTAGVNSLSAHSSWTDIQSATFSKSYNRTTTAYKRTIQYWVGDVTYSSLFASSSLALTVPARPVYTLTYKANGGSSTPASQKQTYGYSVKLAGAISRTGYTFKGWYSSATKKTYNAGAEHAPNANTTLTAQWQVNQAIIHSYPNGGIQPESPTHPKPSAGYWTSTINYNNTINLWDVSTSLQLSKVGHYLDTTKAWNTNASGIGTSYDQSIDYEWKTFGSTASTGAQTKTINLYVNWIKDKYNVIYNAPDADSSIPTSTTKEYNTAANTSTTVPQRANYNFYHWNTASDGSGTAISAGALIPQEINGNGDNSDINLYAIWNSVITYNNNLESNPLQTTQIKTINETTSLLPNTTFSREGYILTEWNTAADGSGISYDLTGSTLPTYSTDSPLTLYAIWKTLPVAPEITKMTAICNEYIETEDTIASLEAYYWMRSDSVPYQYTLVDKVDYYTSTADTIANTLKKYFIRTGTGTELDPYVFTLLETENYYELTSDTTVDSTQIYYERSGSGTTDNPYIFINIEPEEEDNPHDLGYYVLINPYSLGYYELINPRAQGYYELIESDSGNTCVISLDWSIDGTSEYIGDDNTPTFSGTYQINNDQTIYSYQFIKGITGLNGTAKAIIDISTINAAINFSATLSDSTGTIVNKSTQFVPSKFVLDFKSGGKAIGIGRPAPNEGLAIGYDTTIEKTLDVKDTLYINGIALIDKLYPIGSCYITSTYYSPSNFLGGAWSLIDKGFAYKYFSSTGANNGGVTWNTTNTSNGAHVLIRKGNNIQFRLSWYNKVAYADTTLTLATINTSYFGLGVAQPHYECLVADSDGLNAILICSMAKNSSNNNLTFQLEDTIYKNGATTTSSKNQNCRIYFSLLFSIAEMNNDECDKFIWKRIQ